MKKISIVAAVVVAMCLSAVAAEGWNMFERRLGMFVHWGIYSVGEWHEQEEMRRGMCRAEYEKCAERFKDGGDCPQMR